jgi:hypothetical protein
MDTKKIMDKLKGESDRKRVSLYLSESTLEAFKKACHPIAPSKVMEELMKEFVESRKRPNKKN